MVPLLVKNIQKLLKLWELLNNFPNGESIAAVFCVFMGILSLNIKQIKIIWIRKGEKVVEIDKDM